MLTKRRDDGIGIIQCEQCTQDTAHIEKSNTGFTILIPPFSLSTAEYYHTKFLSSLTPNAIQKTQKCSNQNVKIIPTAKVQNQ